MKSGVIEYKSISNPHKKGNARKNENMFLEIKQTKVAEKDINQENQPEEKYDIYSMKLENYSEDELKLEENTIIAQEDKFEPPVNKARRLLAEGLIYSFVDFFYIYQRKIPNLTLKYRKLHKIESQDELKPSYDQSSILISLKVKLQLIEKKYMRLKAFPIVIEKYLDIRTNILHKGDSYSSVYFNEIAINIAKNREHMDYLIKSFYYMGNCFEKPEDSILRIEFMEQAKELFEKHGARDQRMGLDKSLYDALMKLYEELAIQQENQNNFEKACEFLKKQLNNLNSKISVMTNFTEKEDGFVKQVSIYLKIAELNFKQKCYNEALDDLSTAKNIVMGLSEKKTGIREVRMFLFRF